ncbi:MAG: hypothetical protein ACRERC_27015, partial [Candidatus Binatia bacterium]
MIRATRRGLLLLLLASAMLPAAPAAAATPGELCEKAASDNLRTCVKKVGKLQRRCYEKTGSACAAADAKLVEALARVGSKVLPKCPDQATVQAGGYGAALTPSGLVARIESACVGAVA